MLAERGELGSLTVRIFPKLAAPPPIAPHVYANDIIAHNHHYSGNRAKDAAKGEPERATPLLLLLGRCRHYSIILPARHSSLNHKLAPNVGGFAARTLDLDDELGRTFGLRPME